jgi:endonuclease/exonuclease/phosphatase family metal-dependent hydrolase
MTEAHTSLRMVTYNIHKCRGFDRRVRPDRIAAVLQELKADVLALQEVVNAPDGLPRYDQAHELARALPEFGWSFGANRPLEGGTYGNMTLTRLPLLHSRNHDLSHGERERRGALQTDLDAGGGRVLHVFNVHLGTSIRERRQQAKQLLTEEVLLQGGLSGTRVVLGDFNDWTRGLTTRLLRETFKSFRPRHAMRFPGTFPGMLPMVTLDHCYYEPPLKLVETKLWRSPRALVASDHLPLVAEFQWE